MTRTLRYLPLLLVALVVLVVPAAAVEEIDYSSVKSFDISASEDLVISSVLVSEIPEGGDVSLYLNAYGQIYLLSVESNKDWGYWGFNVSCTYPNGTTQSETLNRLEPFAGTYRVMVQPYFVRGNLPQLSVGLKVGLMPTLSATFQGSGLYPQVDDLAFYQVTGSMSEASDVAVWMVTADEFESQQDDDLGLAVSEAVSAFFSWTWEQVLLWSEKVPYVGGFFSISLGLVGVVIGELVWLLADIIVQYLTLLILMVESFIIVDAVTSTRQVIPMLIKIVKNNIWVIRGTISIVQTLLDLLLKPMDTIANILKTIFL